MENRGSLLFIFGATGDLATKKILPALQHWYGEEVPFARIWCLGRRALDKGGYCRLVEEKGGFRLSDPLRARIAYHRLEFDDPWAYADLRDRCDTEPAVDGRRLFFLAVKPDAFVTVATRLQQAGLFVRDEPNHRLLFEKPFGESRTSAEEIQARLMTLAVEEQVYRIDHYLGKDMIRNLLAIRFANRIFAESWHGRAIETVEITSVETAGAEERFEYYDRAGAINDMVQSHLLQMLALVAMAAPDNFEAEPIRRRKIDVLQHVGLDPDRPPVLGQYRGYGPEGSASSTETYVEVALRVDSGQWPDTVFLLKTGKKLGEKRTEIRLRYRANSLCLNCSEKVTAEANELVIEVHPQEGVLFRFNSKVPGYGYALEPVLAHYCHSCRVGGSMPEAYVKLLKDALAGDKTLFAGFAELLVQWRIADRIRGAARGRDLVIYEPGVMTVTGAGGAGC